MSKSSMRFHNSKGFKEGKYNGPETMNLKMKGKKKKRDLGGLESGVFIDGKKVENTKKAKTKNTNQ